MGADGDRAIKTGDDQLDGIGFREVVKACIYERMREYLIKKDILHADETTLQVLDRRGRAADAVLYM